MEETNARIESTMLGMEDHGIMTAFLHLDYGGGGQGAGGYALDTYDKNEKQRVATVYMGKFVQAVLETIGVEKWEDLPGKYIRARHDYGKVYAIGNVLNNKWLVFDELFKEQE